MTYRDAYAQELRMTDQELSQDPDRAEPIEVEEAPAPDDGDLRRIATLAAEMNGLDARIADAEAALGLLQIDRNRIARVDLPAAMMAVGMTNFGLEDGSSVRLDEIVKAGLTDDTREAGIAWLRENGYGDLVKRAITVAFAMGEDDLAQALAAHIHEACPNNAMADKQTVLPQTLTAFVKERIAAGAEGDLPADVLGIFKYREAKVAWPKEKKSKSRGAQAGSRP